MDDGRPVMHISSLVLSAAIYPFATLFLWHSVPRFQRSALRGFRRSGPRRQIDLSADYSSISEQGPAREQLKTIFSRVREDDALEVHRQSDDSFDVFELDCPFTLENDLLIFLGVDESDSGLRRAVSVRKLAEKNYLSMSRRILASVYSLDNVNNARHPGDLIEDDPATGYRRQQNWLYFCHLMDLPFKFLKHQSNGDGLCIQMYSVVLQPACQLLWTVSGEKAGTHTAISSIIVVPY
jgi:hypothetical protein